MKKPLEHKFKVVQMILRIVISSLLALTAANAVAGNMYLYKDKGGQVKLTNINSTGNFDKFTKVTNPSGIHSTPKKINKNVYLDIADKDDNLNNGEINQAIDKLKNTAKTTVKSSKNPIKKGANSAYLNLSDKSNGLSDGDKKRLMTDMAEELRLAEEKLIIAKSKLEKHNLKMYSEWRKRGTLTPHESQIILSDGKNGLVDVGAKIGMSHNQVLKNTYWGKADRTHTITDEYGKLDYWSYEYYGALVFDNNKLIAIYANPITSR